MSIFLDTSLRAIQCHAMQSNAMLLNVPAVAKALSVSERKVRQLLRDGDLRSVRVGARVLVARVDLDEYIEQLRRGRQD